MNLLFNIFNTPYARKIKLAEFSIKKSGTKFFFSFFQQYNCNWILQMLIHVKWTYSVGKNTLELEAKSITSISTASSEVLAIPTTIPKTYSLSVLRRGQSGQAPLRTLNVSWTLNVAAWACKNVPEIYHFLVMKKILIPQKIINWVYFKL